MPAQISKELTEIIKASASFPAHALYFNKPTVDELTTLLRQTLNTISDPFADLFKGALGSLIGLDMLVDNDLPDGVAELRKRLGRATGEIEMLGDTAFIKIHWEIVQRVNVFAPDDVTAQ